MRAFALCVIACQSLLTHLAHAEPAVTVLVLEPIQPDMLQRVQGQLSDKAARILAVQAPGKNDLERAFHAAQRHQAGLVVWFSDAAVPSPGAPAALLRVYVLDVHQLRLVEREVPAPKSGEAMGRSARDEAAAFIVRGAVEDLSEGRGVGRPVQPPAPETQPCPAPQPVPQLAQAPPPPHVFVLGGAFLAADGIALLRGPQAAVLLRAGRFTFGGHAQFSYASQVDRSGFSLDVSRYDLRGIASYGLLGMRQVELSVGASLGPSLQRRTTRAVPEGYVVAPPATEPDFSLGVFGASSFRLTRRDARLRIALGVEAGVAQRDLLVRGRSAPLDTAWPLQPFAQLGLLLPIL